MVLTINLAPLCNTHGFLYNKEKNPPKLKIDSKKIAKRYDDLGIVVLKPIIDRFIFSFSPTNEMFAEYGIEEDLAEYKKQIVDSLFASAKIEGDGLCCISDVPFMAAPYKHYDRNFLYKPKGSKEAILVQVQPKKEHWPFIAFDMNVSRLSLAAIKEFRAFIEETFVLPGTSVLFHEFMGAAVIRHIEIAFDILGARPADTEILKMKTGKPFPCKTMVFKGKTGRAETMYLDVKKGKSSKACIYDKRTEQLERGVTPAYGDTLHTRYEVTINKTNAHKLATIQNYCKRISVKAPDYKKMRRLGHVQQFFVATALHRSIQKALGMLPPKLQAKHEKLYNDLFHDIWDADMLWTHWKDYYATCGLFPAAPKCTQVQIPDG